MQSEHASIFPGEHRTQRPHISHEAWRRLHALHISLREQAEHVPQSLHTPLQSEHHPQKSQAPALHSAHPWQLGQFFRQEVHFISTLQISSHLVHAIGQCVQIRVSSSSSMQSWHTSQFSQN